jgi:hypothetical protein
MFQLLWSLFLGLATTLPGRVLTALGIGVVTYAAQKAVVDTLIASLRSSFVGLPADVLQIAQLAGFIDCFEILIAAILARVALDTMPKLGVLSAGGSA